MLVRNDIITENLIHEAKARIADRRMEFFTERTAAIVHGVLTPIDPRADKAVVHRKVLVGSGPLDRKVRADDEATVVPEAQSAPMLETPDIVAKHLRIIVGAETR